MSKNFVALKIAIVKPSYLNLPTHPSGHDGYEIDQHGIGMHYDKGCCDFDDNGFRYAVTALPEERANAYIARGQGRVVKMTEAEAEAFFVEHCKYEPEEVFDLDRLQAIKLKKDFGLPLTEDDNNAINPDNAFVRGISKNLKKGFRNKLPKDAIVL